MTIEEKIKEARRLMFEVTKERRAKAQNQTNKMYKGSHKRKDHAISYSINYTGGFCSKCDCEHFLMN